MSKEVDSEVVEDASKNVDNPDDAAELIGRIVYFNNILMLAYQQGIIFKKYKDNNEIMSAVAKFKIHKNIINFKIGIIKFFDDYPKMRKSSISLHFLKNNFGVVKDFCKVYASEFQ